MNKSKLVIGKEYWVLQQNATLERIEGDEAVMRNRWDSIFKVNVGDLQEKPSYKEKEIKPEDDDYDDGSTMTAIIAACSMMV